MTRILAVTILGLLLGCGGGGPLATAPGSGGGGGSSTTCPIPTANPAPSWSGHLLPAFQSSCGASTGSCHGGSGLPSGHFSFATGNGRTATDVYNDLVNADPSNAPIGQGWKRVKPSDVSRSWIVEKLTQDQPGGSGFGARMPLAAPNLCQATLDTLIQWVSQGAHPL